MANKIEMVALRRIRIKSGQAFKWVSAGETYALTSNKDVKFHETTKRGERKKPKSKGDKS